MRYSALQTAEEWDWFHARTNTILCGDMCGIVARKQGRIVAMAVFDSFTEVACNVHMAIDDPFVLRHGFLEGMGNYLFNVRNRQRLYGLVPSNNDRALKLNKHIGLTELAVIPNAVAEGVDYIVMTMEKADCRWIPEVREAA